MKTAAAPYVVPAGSPDITVTRSQWARRYIKRAALLDCLVVVLSIGVAFPLRQLITGEAIGHGMARTVAAIGFAALVPLTWLGALAVAGCYDRRVVGAGSDEYRGVIKAGLVVLAGISIIDFVFRFEVPRGLIAVCIPVTVVLTLVERMILRNRLHSRRRQGTDRRQTLLVGQRSETVLVAQHLDASPWAGFHTVGTYSTDLDEEHARESDRSSPTETPAPPTTIVDRVINALEGLDADTLVVTNAGAFGTTGLRDLAWRLEGSGVHLIVAPAVTDLAGPRISARPVAGLPLLHVEEPRLSVGARIFKAIFDRTAAALALVLLSPLMLVVAIAVKVTSPGSVLFRQSRVGLDGESFEFLKFRTMVSDAEATRHELADQNEADGPLFKVQDDPRRTTVGRFLRRFSIDELPQLFHVLSGRMSVVGPRPPLPGEVEVYDDHVHRKFLVKPGLTGLWQVSGRSDLEWEESVRIDLYYVDNWSPTMDLAICLRTFGAVALGKGAY